MWPRVWFLNKTKALAAKMRGLEKRTEKHLRPRGGFEKQNQKHTQPWGRGRETKNPKKELFSIFGLFGRFPFYLHSGWPSSEPRNSKNELCTILSLFDVLHFDFIRGGRRVYVVEPANIESRLLSIFESCDLPSSGVVGGRTLIAPKKSMSISEPSLTLSTFLYMLFVVGVQLRSITDR